MTEQDWLASDNPQAMLNYLLTGNRVELGAALWMGHPAQVSTGSRLPCCTDRKLRMWVEACRENYNHPPYELDLSDPKDLLLAAQDWASHYLASPTKQMHLGLLRDVFGNPFRPFSHYNWLPWLSWNNGTVPKLAEVIYDECRFGDLPLLADALEEAGCADEEILRHCRGIVWCHGCNGTGKRDVMVDAGYNNPLMTRPGWAYCWVCNDYGNGPTPGWHVPREPLPHTRGCWVLDLLLGKE